MEAVTFNHINRPDTMDHRTGSFKRADPASRSASDASASTTSSTSSSASLKRAFKSFTYKARGRHSELTADYYEAAADSSR